MKALKAVAAGHMEKLERLWLSHRITIRTKIRLMRPVVMAIVLYAVESRTMSTVIEMELKSFEIKCYREILGISWKKIK